MESTNPANTDPQEPVVAEPPTPTPSSAEQTPPAPDPSPLPEPLTPEPTASETPKPADQSPVAPVEEESPTTPPINPIPEPISEPVSPPAPSTSSTTPPAVQIPEPAPQPPPETPVKNSEPTPPEPSPLPTQPSSHPGIPAELLALSDAHLRIAATYYLQKNQADISRRGVAARQAKSQQNLDAITAYVQSKGTVRLPQIAKALNLSPGTTSHYLQNLIKAGHIKATGHAQARRYFT